MGTCTHCGKSAGLFRSAHPECQAKAEQRAKDEDAARQKLEHQAAERSQRAAAGARALRDSLARAIATGEDIKSVDRLASDLVADEVIDFDARRSALAAGWVQAVKQLLDDGVLTQDEEARLMEAKDRLHIATGDVTADGAYGRVAFASQLRRVAAGDPGIQIEIPPGFPVNFARGESPVWTFPNTDYLEDRQRRQYDGRSQGVSVRVARGVYVRLGAFKGEPVISTETVHADTGLLVLGSQNLYFVGPRKSMRVPYRKIISLTRFADGVGIHRDAASAKPQAFRTGDGWATYNLLAALCNAAAS